MNDTPFVDRRTVLGTIAAASGVGVASGVGSAGPGNAHGRRAGVEIVAEHDHEDNEHRFELSTDEVDSGWVTLEFDNRTEHTHFAYLPKLPARALADAADAGMDPLSFYVETVTRPFQYFWDSMVDGKQPDPAYLSDEYDSLFPPWFGDVSFHGGAGLTSGGRTSKTTVRLDPGKYIVECYVKDDNNDFHSTLGMIDLLTVTGDEGDAPEPDSTVDLSLSVPGSGGIDFPESVRPGRHVVGVTFENQQAYANLVGHDAHLVRLEDGTTARDVNSWMNWADQTQFISDGHEPQTFLGGVSDIFTADLPETGYMHVNLRPGDYVWVAEVPDPDSQGLLQSFTVPSDRGRGRR